jgi:hypothetical protein
MILRFFSQNEHHLRGKENFLTIILKKNTSI